MNIGKLSATGLLVPMFSTRLNFIFTSLFVTTFAMTMPIPASAEPIAAEQATQLLARSQALEEKCKFLSAAQHDELSAFMARAEVAMVTRTSAKAAKLLISSGRAQAKGAMCTNAERMDIVDILGAAQQATMHKIQTAQMSPPVKPAAMPAQSEKPKPMFAKLNKPAVEVKSVTTKPKLNQYAKLAERYYLARRCNSMSISSINSLYKTVVSTHRDVIVSFGVPAVRAVMKRSEQQANVTQCG